MEAFSYIQKIATNMATQETTNNIKEEPADEEDSAEGRVTKTLTKCCRHPEFRAVNTLQPAFWKKVENELKMEGKTFQTGQFTEAENKQLKKNWTRLTRECPLREPEVILRKSACPELSQTIKQFVVEKNFYVRLGHKINRSPYNVYLRARKVFNVAEKVGEYSKEEEKKLKSLELTHGNKWEEIGRAMGRSGHSAFKKARCMEKEVVRGRWSADEVVQLRRGIRKIIKNRKKERMEKEGGSEEETKEEMTEDKREEYFNLPWDRIAEYVPTRNSRQCREHWLHADFNNSEQSFRRKKKHFSTDEKKKLVQELIDMGIKEESKIDWMSVHSKFTDLPTPQYVRYRWCQIKKGIPKFRSKEFEELLQLAKKKLDNPDLELPPSKNDHTDCSDDGSTLNENVKSKQSSSKSSPPRKRKRPTNESPLSQTQNLSQDEVVEERVKKSKKRKIRD